MTLHKVAIRTLLHHIRWVFCCLAVQSSEKKNKQTNQ